MALDWAGASGDQVDVYLDGRLYTTTQNDGDWTYRSNNRGSGSYTFQVCEAGTDRCSNESTAWI